MFNWSNIRSILWSTDNGYWAQSRSKETRGKYAIAKAGLPQKGRNPVRVN